MGPHTYIDTLPSSLGTKGTTAPELVSKRDSTTTTVRSTMPAEAPRRPTLDGLEEKWSARWRAEGTYGFDRTKTRDEVYSSDTPPPTVSGSLHVGHVFSYTHTDLVARYQRKLHRVRHIVDVEHGYVLHGGYFIQVVVVCYHHAARIGRQTQKFRVHLGHILKVGIHHLDGYIQLTLHAVENIKPAPAAYTL